MCRIIILVTIILAMTSSSYAQDAQKLSAFCEVIKQAKNAIQQVEIGYQSERNPIRKEDKWKELLETRGRHLGLIYSTFRESSSSLRGMVGTVATMKDVGLLGRTTIVLDLTICPGSLDVQFKFADSKRRQEDSLIDESRDVLRNLAVGSKARITGNVAFGPSPDPIMAKCQTPELNYDSTSCLDLSRGLKLVLGNGRVSVP